jgi:hypothetical protein
MKQIMASVLTSSNDMSPVDRSEVPNPGLLTNALGLAAIPICADTCGDAVIALRSALNTSGILATARDRNTYQPATIDAGSEEHSAYAGLF